MPAFCRRAGRNPHSISTTLRSEAAVVAMAPDLSILYFSVANESCTVCHRRPLTTRLTVGKESPNMKHSTGLRLIPQLENHLLDCTPTKFSRKRLSRAFLESKVAHKWRRKNSQRLKKTLNDRANLLDLEWLNGAPETTRTSDTRFRKANDSKDGSD